LVLSLLDDDDARLAGWESAVVPISKVKNSGWEALTAKSLNGPNLIYILYYFIIYKICMNIGF
jgi:hypothetical protein